MSENGKIRIGDHVTILPGFPFNSRLFNTDGIGLPLIRIRDLLQSKIETYYDGEYPTEFAIKEGDILIGMDGDFHIVKWRNKRKALLNQRILKVAQKQGGLIDVNYFYYYLFPFLKNVWDRTTATTVKHLSTYDISEAQCSFPSISEQREIAQILSATESVIEKTQQAIAKYKAIKQGMLHDLFTCGIDIKTGKLRPRYAEAPELYKESKLGWVPKEWEVDELFAFTEKIGSGVTPSGGSEVYKSSGVLFLRSQNVLTGRLSIHDVAFISHEIDEKMEGSRVKPYDVLLNITGASIGRSAYFPAELRAANVNQHVCIIRFYAASKHLAIFASEFLNSPIGQRQISRSNAGGNRDGLNFQQIKSFSFFKIEDMELRKISKIIEAKNMKLLIEETYLHKLQQIKQGLMSDLLSGKKRVKVEEK